MGEARRRRIAGDTPRSHKLTKPSASERKRIQQVFIDEITFNWQPGMFPALALAAKLRKRRLDAEAENTNTF